MKHLFLILFAANANAATVEDISGKIGACLQNGQNPTVAVLDFEYINKTDTISPQIIQERLTTALSRSRKVTIVERKLIEKVLRELYSQATGVLGAQETAKLGQMLNADYILTGTLSDFEKNQVEINARVISVASSTVSCAERAIILKDWKTSIVLPQNSEINTLPENIKSQFDLANLYLENRAYKKSIEMFSSLLQQPSPAITPVKWEIYWGRANAYALEKNSAAALSDTDKVIELNPKFSPVYTLRGLIYGCLSPEKERRYAVAEFSQAIKYAPNDKFLYALKGNSELASRRFDEARQDYKVALSTDHFAPAVNHVLVGWSEYYDLIGDPFGGPDPSPPNNWLEIGQQHLDHIACYVTEKDWDYTADIHTKIALTYALEKDSATAISYIAANFKELPWRYPNTETLLGIFFGFNDYSSIIKLCGTVRSIVTKDLCLERRRNIFTECSAGYRAVKNYNLAINTLEPLLDPDAPYDFSLWGLRRSPVVALKYLYMHEDGKSWDVISAIKLRKRTADEISLVFAIINFEIGKMEIAKNFFNLYLKDELSDESRGMRDTIYGSIKEYLTPKEKSSFSTLYKITAKEGPISDERLEAFKKEYFK